MSTKTTKNLLILTCGLLLWIFSPEGYANTRVLINSEPKGGWRLFGSGLLDSAVDIPKSEIIINVDWMKSSWGIGGMFTWDAPIIDKNLSAIQVDVRTKKGSKTKIYAGMATKKDANLIFPRTKAKDVTNQWQTFIFTVSEMIKDMPNASSVEFTDGDWRKIQIIKVLFTTPEKKDVPRDDILIRNPELIYDVSEPTNKVNPGSVKKI